MARPECFNVSMFPCIGTKLCCAQSNLLCWMMAAIIGTAYPSTSSTYTRCRCQHLPVVSSHFGIILTLHGETMATVGIGRETTAGACIITGTVSEIGSSQRDRRPQQWQPNRNNGELRVHQNDYGLITWQMIFRSQPKYSVHPNMSVLHVKDLLHVRGLD